MQVKTITTAAGINEIDFGNDGSQSTAHFYWLKNLGDSTLYVSANPNPIAEKDDVAELPAKGAVSVETDEGKIYILGAGKVEIHRTNSKFCPFDWQSSGSGGGGGGSITVDSELSDTSTNPLQNKVTTAAIKEVNSALETKSDINHIHDISASGNPVIMDNLQGGVPFSEMAVSGKNLIGIAQAKVLGGNENSGYNVIDSPYSRTIIQKLHPNTAYTVKKYDSGNRFRIVLFNNEPSTAADITAKQLVINSEGSITEYTFTTDTANLWFAFTTHSATSGDAVEPIVQLELGDTATAYEPPITGRELTVNVSGKNLIPPATQSFAKNGITFTAANDGKVILNGTATDNTIYWLGKLEIKAGTYTVSGLNSVYNDGRGHIGIRNSDGSVISSFYEGSSTNGTTTINEDMAVQPIIYIYSGKTFNNELVYPQLELGDTATVYEPYHGSTITITPDSNPYTIPDDIRQQEGLNVVSVSAGELSVVGVQKNAAIKRIWDDMRMDLLFDGTVTAGTNCITDNINGYNFLYFYGNLSSVSGESGNVTGSLVIPKNTRAISAGQSLVVTTGVIYITVNIISIESSVITFTVTLSDSNREIYEFKVFGIK